MTPERRYLITLAENWRNKRKEPYGGRYGHNAVVGCPKTQAVLNAERTIKQAQKTIARWEARRNRVRDHAFKAIDARFEHMKQHALFDAPKDALIAIKKLST